MHPAFPACTSPGCRGCTPRAPTWASDVLPPGPQVSSRTHLSGANDRSTHGTELLPSTHDLDPELGTGGHTAGALRCLRGPQTALRGAGRGLPLSVRPCTGAAHRGSLCWRGVPLPRPPPPLPGEPLHAPSSDTSEQPTRRQENPGIHTRWPVHMMEYYLAIKRNEALARAP